MKLHVPLPLRTALMAACAVASLTPFTRAVILENHDTSATDAFKELYGEGTSYTIGDELQFRNNHVTGDFAQGGALSVDGDIFFRNSGEIEMTGNYAEGETSRARGGALYAGGQVVFEGVGRVTLNGNYAVGAHAPGGAIDAGGDIVFRGCSEVEIADNYTESTFRPSDMYLPVPDLVYGGALFTDGRVTFEENDRVTLSGNYAAMHRQSADSFVAFVTGGAIDAHDGIIFRNCGAVEITGNCVRGILPPEQDEGYTYFPCYDYGGALDAGGDIVFEANSRVVVRGNYVAGEEDGEGTCVLTAFHTRFPGGGLKPANMEIKVKEGQSFESYDGGWIEGILYINGDQNHLVPEKEDAARYCGTVTFSGRYTEEDLESIMGRELTSQEIDRGILNPSRVLYARGVRVCDGTLALEDGSILFADDRKWHDVDGQVQDFENGGLVVGEYAQLVMKDATVYTEKTLEYDVDPPTESGDTQEMISGGDASISSASFSGANTIYAHSLESTGGTWTFNVSEKNLTDPLVTLKFHVPHEDMKNGEWINATGPGTFTSQKGTVFDIEFEGTLAEGQYKLLEFDKTDGTWEHEAGIPEITGKAGSTTIGEEGEGDVYLMTDGNTVTLIFDVAGASVEPEPEPEPSPEPSPEPTPEDRQPTTLTWDNGNGTWADGKGNEDGHWAGEVTDKNFRTGDSVVFNGAAEVTLQGVVRPGSVLVNNTEGTVRFTGNGQITDVDIPSQQVKLIKEGAGTLVIDTNNAYTGGTELRAGTLVAGNAGALGLGVVRVSGGTLDMGGNALDNELDVAGTANVVNSGKYVGKLVLESGELSGDLNLGQDAELKGGTVAGVLSGKGGAVVSGDVTLSGANTYAGKTTVQGGGNLHVTGSLASRELEVQSGGTYSGAIGGAGLSVNLAGGAIEGNVTLGEGSTFRATAQGAAVKGKLRVASGGRLSVRDVQEGATLTVSELVADGGTLGLDPAKADVPGVETFTTTGNKTAVDVGEDALNWEAGEYTLFTYKSLGAGSSVDSLYLAALEGLNSRKQFDLRLEQTGLVLTVEGVSADLTWQGGTGTWDNGGTSGGWNASTGDSQFLDGDRVTFDASTQNVEAKIEGTVTPGGIIVQGDKDVTLRGGGNIAGSAPLTKKGKGTLDVQTDNGSYRGDITVTEGTLRAGNANALGTGSVLVEGATFDANNMNVAAKVTMRGQSTLENAGNMKTLTFDSGSSVKSTSGYTLSSGNTLTIGPTGSAYTGDFTFGGGVLTLTGGAFDLSHATVSFNGEQHSVLDLSGWVGLTYGQEYTVLTGEMAVDSLDVRLGNGMDNYAHLEVRDGSVVLVIEQPGDVPGGTPGTLPSLNRDQGAAYGVLTQAMGSGTATGTLAVMAEQVAATTDPGTVRALLDRLSGAELATAISSQTEGNMAHLRRLRGAIGSGQVISSNHRVGAYITGYTEDNRLEQDAQGRGFRRTEIGGTLGLETARKDGQYVVGVALSAGRAHVSPTGPAPRYHEDATREDLYFVANYKRLRSTTTVGLGDHEYNMRRSLPNGMGTHANDVSGNSVNLSEELAVTLSRSEKYSFESFFAVESSYNHIDSFREDGADTASLEVSSHNACATDLSLGLRANFLFPIVSSAPSAVFSVQGAVITSVGDTVTDVTMRYTGAPELPYSVRSAKRNRWGYSAGASLTVPVSKNAAIFGSGEAILRGDSHEVTATVGAKLVF